MDKINLIELALMQKRYMQMYLSGVISFFCTGVQITPKLFEELFGDRQPDQTIPHEEANMIEKAIYEYGERIFCLEKVGK